MARVFGIVLFICMAFVGHSYFFQAAMNESLSQSSQSPSKIPIPEPKPILAPFQLPGGCDELIRGLEKNGFSYGWVETLEDEKRAESLKIHTFYYYRDFKKEPHKDLVSYKTIPIAIFNGGPSADSHNTSSFFMYEAPQLNAVFIDQRGTGCSTPYPEDSRPVDIIHWGTSGIVRDAEAVRIKLGYAKWNIFGQSYGSIIVQRYVEQAPQSILRAVGHGGAITLNSADFLQIRMNMQRNLIKEYISEHPEDREKIKAIVKRRLYLDDVKVSGASLMREVGGSWIGYRLYWDSLHEKIDEIFIRGKTAPLGSGKSIPIPEHDFSQNSVLILEFSGRLTSWMDCFQANRVALRDLQDSELLTLSECWEGYGQSGPSVEKIQRSEKSLKQLLNFAPIDPKVVRTQLEKNPDLQYYLFSSDGDFYMPAAQVSMAASQMGPRVKYQNLKNADHFAYLHPKIVELLAGK